MKQLKMRFPNKKDSAQMFLLCVFPTHTWALIIFLNELPAYIKQLRFLEITSLLGYVLSFSLLESLLIFVIIVSLAMFLPGKWFFERFIAQGIVLVIASMIWFVLINFIIWDNLLKSSRYTGSDHFMLSQFGVLGFVWITTFLIIVIVLSIALRRSNWLERLLNDFADRISILSVFFLFIDLLSIGSLGVRCLIE